MKAFIMIMTVLFKIEKTGGISHFGIYPISIWYKAYLNLVYPLSQDEKHIITIQK